MHVEHGRTRIEIEEPTYAELRELSRGFGYRPTLHERMRASWLLGVKQALSEVDRQQARNLENLLMQLQQPNGGFYFIVKRSDLLECESGLEQIALLQQCAQMVAESYKIVPPGHAISECVKFMLRPASNGTGIICVTVEFLEHALPITEMVECAI